MNVQRHRKKVQTMPHGGRFTCQINAGKPTNYMKRHAAELARDFSETGSPIIMPQNGETRAMLQDIRDYEQLQESLALLKILAHSRNDVEAERLKPMEESFAGIRARMPSGGSGEVRPVLLEIAGRAKQGAI